MKIVNNPFFIIISIVSLVLLSACSNETLDSPSSISDQTIYSSYKIRCFASAEEVVSAFNNYSGTAQTRAEDGFVSYLETVMSEPGYDDLPYAILSDAFGSLLNKDGELAFDNNLIHVSKYGLLFGPVEEAAIIRNLAQDEKLPSLCTSHGYYEPLDNDRFFKVKGYDNIYLYDTFGIVGGCDTSIVTRSDYTMYTGHVEQHSISSTSPEVAFRWQENGLWREDWGKQFTIPSASEQKQIFSDGQHCNDTKIYHQDYAIATDTGLKTKTMKKRALGYWDKVYGDMEAGIIELSVFEQLPSNLTNTQGSTCTVYFGNKSYLVKNNDVGNHSLTYYLQTLTWANVESAAIAANVNAIRYIDWSSKQAITFFPNQIVQDYVKKIELSFRVPFGGVSQGPGYNNGDFHVIHQKFFGVTVRDNEIRGTDIDYWY